jgi:uncharacterized protein
MSEKHLVEIKSYPFSSELVSEIKDNNFVKGCWPLVYILSDEYSKQAYVGETTDALSRLSTHLKNPKKNILTTARLIMSDKFNKSAALDIESNLIKYLAGDGKFKLLNANLGIANHSYYQKKEVYWDIFLTLWEELKSEGIVSGSIEAINNSDLFKYSPYKALTSEQKVGLISLIKTLLDDNSSTVLVEGGAGTGKTILAIYLFAILYTDIEDLDFNEFAEEEQSFLELVQRLKNKYPNPKAALIIPMSGFRETISKVFRNVKNLRASMVIGPAEVTNSEYDILIVDESHRLRKRVNLGAYFGAFDKVNLKLGFAKESGDELDWVLKQSRKNLFFYDAGQSIKPSDVDGLKFQTLKESKQTTLVKLYSQLRSKGGNDYVSYISGLLSNSLSNSDKEFKADNYEFVLFESLSEMVDEIKNKNQKYGLARLVAGFSWKWISNTPETSHLHDIVIGDVKLKWNGTNIDWVNSANAENEVGCIHTTQGYDLNFTGVIFGNEISFDKKLNQIVIKDEHYLDRNGRQNVRSPEELREFITNIYKTLLLRAVKGTYVYVCDPDLREYFKQHVAFKKSSGENIKLENQTSSKPVVSPYSEEMVNLPLYDSVGCGELMLADANSDESIEVPKWLIKPGAKYFALRTRGDSMNRLDINNGDIILCQKNLNATSGNAVILIGDDATLKEIKLERDGLLLVPKSTNPEHRIRKLTADDEFKILGIFVCKLAQ